MTIFIAHPVLLQLSYKKFVLKFVMATLIKEQYFSIILVTQYFGFIFGYFIFSNQTFQLLMKIDKYGP